ncbi:F0F1 ATP synthase subunit B [Subtercola boreus]|uniref:ATP synthase subunit b n=1 Tax=Subtercola boreus TaxID=120213 RepID=A0A3E0W9B5_9MICO|nr:F0F1 ATP synthase subunit B [Subtercola boreus]RFA20277.1 F0F1 ATP synthase subunit B [Subtercola boreus]RFA20429.1 F0F1 ATP synthase subunit B [Subtercola boreus]RFA26681.1 F0F1 ATP synthase subunit B [Subtercola boreus]
MSFSLAASAADAVVRAAAEGDATHNPVLPETPDLIWGAVCFLVLLIFFWRAVLPRVKKLLDERGEAIEGNIEKADVAQREAEAVLAQYTAQLADARVEAGTIREQARHDGQRILAELKDQANTEAARIAANAQAQIEAERQAAVVSLRSEVGTLAIDLASGVIGESLTDDRRSAAIVDRFLADLEASENAAGSTAPASGAVSS